MKRASGARLCQPNFPTVNAIAPNAPIGASHITNPTARKRITEADSIKPTNGRARSPETAAENPTKIAISSTCSNSPEVSAAGKVVGMMFIKKLEMLWLSAAAAYCATAVPSSWLICAWKPAPGLSTLATSTPSNKATVDSASK